MHPESQWGEDWAAPEPHPIAALFWILSRPYPTRLHDQVTTCRPFEIWFRCLFTVLDVRDEVPHHFFSLALPFIAVVHCVLQIFGTRHTKDTTVLEFLGEGDDVKVQKANLSLVPIFGWIVLRTAVHVRNVQFFKETSVPFL
jgi:hypothetical protein